MKKRNDWTGKNMLEKIRHLFKLDPARELSDPALSRVLHSGTGGIVIGGTDGITRENTERLIRRVRREAPPHLPLFLEVSSYEAVFPGMDGYLIPFVLNATDPYWILGAHVAAVKKTGLFIPWEKIQVEGYIILNPAAKAFQVTKAHLPRDEEEALAYAETGGHLLRLPLLYLEYSGRYGDPALVRKVKERLPETHLLYGGGITSREEAEEMGRYADTVVVGNILYEDLEKGLSTVLPA
ncbi:heptaprenylglyceryl phosphate synthase [Thermicanus aegyptius]|uniref:heptaprenylglyceryl phosphate synthase n=1 Tax=Thermicanus aegyptius TaxID=94009 RepID=UPI0004050BBE|nr:heptaprenylglyceryl phosphate synthase [Thermicanus aegyptius]